MTWREISTAQLNLLRSKAIIDVRSPGEHAQERIPAAINIPLLSDEERAQVGTVYKTEGEMQARRLALTIISPKIPSLIESIASRRVHGQALVIHCWRGGLRSEAVASVLSIAGIDCFRLTGGYKAWRAGVLQDFTQDSFDFQPVVLHGLTGVGKTELLKLLAMQGCQILDLETISNHRGSVFGGLGLDAQPTQKNFEGQLWLALQNFQSGPVFLEAEGRKIGKLTVPDCVLSRIRNGIPVLVSGSLNARAQRITDDYLAASTGRKDHLQQAFAGLERLKERLGTKMMTQIQALSQQEKFLEAVSLLLTHYYDPQYRRQIDNAGPFALEVQSDHIDQAATQLSIWCKEQTLLKK